MRTAQAVTPRYLMIARGGRHEIEIRKSWFICTANRANTEEEARGYAESIRREFWDASHNCVAWVIGDDGRFQRSNDDGEPAGTAGMPMLEVLRRRTITDTVVVVARYFGGIKLGVGGLIRAYGQSVADTVDAIGIVERRTRTRVSVQIGHHDAGRFEHAIRTAGYQLAEVAYDGFGVTFSLTMAPDSLSGFDDWIAKQSNGQAAVVIGDDLFVEVPVSGDHT
jgi:uncharacterized YigZ family protein